MQRRYFFTYDFAQPNSSWKKGVALLKGEPYIFYTRGEYNLACAALRKLSGARYTAAPGMGGAQQATMREASYSTVTAPVWIQSRSSNTAADRRRKPQLVTRGAKWRMRFV